MLLLTSARPMTVRGLLLPVVCALVVGLLLVWSSGGEDDGPASVQAQGQASSGHR